MYVPNNLISSLFRFVLSFSRKMLLLITDCVSLRNIIKYFCVTMCILLMSKNAFCLCVYAFMRFHKVCIKRIMSLTDHFKLTQLLISINHPSKHSYQTIAGSILVHRLRRCPNIKPTLV